MLNSINKIKNKLSQFSDIFNENTKWLSEKDDEGKRLNLKLAGKEILESLVSSKFLVSVTSATITACMLGGLIAYKKTFWANEFNDIEENLLSKSKVVETRNPSEIFKDDFVNDALEAIVKTHKEAPYIKYMFRTAVGVNSVIILGVCGGAISRKKREMENKL